MTEIEEAFSKAYQGMKQKGFTIPGDIRLAVDSSLPIMGYTFSNKGTHVIVVSESAIGSGLLDGLLVHELSHVYLEEADHPSHNQALVEEVLGGFIKEDYRGRVLYEVVNHVKNIYADDVGFKVFEDWDGGFAGDKIREFFLNWIKTEPAVLRDSEQTRWINGSIMVSNAFATATMERHGYLKGFKEKFNDRNAVFLGRVEGALDNFNYFKNYFVKLAPETNPAIFREQLLEYLKRFAQMMGGWSPRPKI